jgi:hypothetical protein
MSNLTKAEISLLKQARKNCLINTERLLWGRDTAYPMDSEIEKANELLETVYEITAFLAGNTGIRNE